ncbi:MAG: AAA family ATPase [Clostridia bacterium]|nr:AAA family ATPase [Clostridia bacterium]
MNRSQQPEEQKPFVVPAVEAFYNAEGLPMEYVGNPFIEALPGIISHKEVRDKLEVPTPFDPRERTFSSETRVHCIARLFWRFFQPMMQHIRIWDYLSICIRQGYIRRNPLDVSSVQRANELYAAAMERREPTVDAKYIPNSVGFAIIGVSGVGKSTAVSSILHQYSQVIQHTHYKGKMLDRKQIVWMKLDCSHSGSERGLCLNFLREVDRLTGTNYFAAYEKRATVDTLLTEMTRVASAYSLGILLVDEIQHLANSRRDSQKLLNFFVTLENTIGVPVVLMGTPGALPLLQGDFRSARRCCAHGDIFWNPLQWDETIQNSEWELFLKAMWQYQWIRNPVDLSVGFVRAMYEETQGIEALAVVLFILLQEEAIRNGTETIRLADISRVAQKDMKIVQPMLNALRSGDPKKIAQYSDVISTFIDDMRSSREVFIESEQPEKSRKKAGEKLISEYLQEMDVPPELAEKYAHEALKKNPKEKPLKLVRTALALYEADEAKKTTGNSESAKKRNRGRPAKAEKAKANDPGDLRNAESYAGIRKEDENI